MGSLAGSLAMLVSGILLVSGTRLGYGEAKIKICNTRTIMEAFSLRQINPRLDRLKFDIFKI
jgi:hypothetical protein